MHKYTKEELKSIFLNNDLANELIPLIKNNKIDQYAWATKYQSQWKYIQRQLTRGLLCPICGTILFKFYDKHLSTKHNYSLQQWYDDYNDIKIRPKCPICGKETKFITAKMIYRQFCGNSHARMLIDEQTGLSYGWILSQIRNHNNVILTKSRIFGKNTTKKYGSEFKITLTYDQRKNRNLLDNNDYFKWQQRQIEKKRIAGKKGGKSFIKRYGCHLPGFGFRSLIHLSKSKSFLLDSQQELFHLLKRIFINKDNINMLENKVFLENTTSQFDGKNAYSDLIVNQNGILTNYEVHYIKDVDAINRKQFCSLLNGYQFQLENINDYTYPNGKYVIELKDYIDINSLYTKLISAHYNKSIYEFNLSDLK